MSWFLKTLLSVYNVHWQPIVDDDSNIWFYPVARNQSIFYGEEIKWDRKGVSIGEKIEQNYGLVDLMALNWFCHLQEYKLVYI